MVVCSFPSVSQPSSFKLEKEAAVSLKSLRNPVEILLPGTDFKMQFGDTHIHLRVAYHGESFADADIGKTTVYLAEVLYEEFLLVYRCRSKSGSLDSVIEPRWCPAADVADFFYGLALVLYALCFPVAESDVAANLLVRFELVCPADFSITYSGPAGAVISIMFQNDSGRDTLSSLDASLKSGAISSTLHPAIPHPIGVTKNVCSGCAFA